MSRDLAFTPGERLGLWLVAAFGFVVLNGLFVFGLVARPGALSAAQHNPVAAAFMIEALVLVGLLAWLLARLGASRLHWGWFVALSMLGGLAFAIPVVLLWPRRATSSKASARP